MNNCTREYKTICGGILADFTKGKKNLSVCRVSGKRGGCLPLVSRSPGTDEQSH